MVTATMILTTAMPAATMPPTALDSVRSSSFLAAAVGIGSRDTISGGYILLNQLYLRTAC